MVFNCPNSFPLNPINHREGLVTNEAGAQAPLVFSKIGRIYSRRDSTGFVSASEKTASSQSHFQLKLFERLSC